MWGMEVQRALLVNLCAGEGENQIVVKKGAYLPPQKLRANGKPLKKVRKRYLWGQQIASIPADGEESMLERIYQDHHRHSHLFVHKGKITPSSLEDVNKDPWVRAQWKRDFFGVRKDEQPCSCREQGSSCPLPWPAQSLLFRELPLEMWAGASPRLREIQWRILNFFSTAQIFGLPPAGANPFCWYVCCYICAK